MSLSRRAFLGSVAAFAAADGLGLANGSPRLKFGVLSDIHIYPLRPEGSVERFLTALRYFRDHGADAVVIAGDLADWGIVTQIDAVIDAWQQVFPGGKAPDGREVARLFVCGNHDLEGQWYNYDKRYGVPKEMFADEHSILCNLKTIWPKLTGFPYDDLWIRDVKGYKFVGCNKLQYPKDCTFLEDHRAELEGANPFFYIQHFHPQGTCSAPWVWGQDEGWSTKALSRFPNAVAFSGHSHTPLVDERTIWQGGFTSVGTASLRYLISFGGRENSFAFGMPYEEHEQMPRLNLGNAANGLLVTIYDDCMILERMDFAVGSKIADDWVVPLPYDGSLAFGKRAARSPVPQFAEGAEVTVSPVSKGKDRKGRPTDQVTVSFPPADGSRRAFDYEVTVEASDVDIAKPWKVKRVFSDGYYRPPAYDGDKVECVFAVSELPGRYEIRETCHTHGQKGLNYRFAVRPVNCFGAKGAPLYTNWLEGDRIWKGTL